MVKSDFKSVYRKQHLKVTQSDVVSIRVLPATFFSSSIECGNLINFPGSSQEACFLATGWPLYMLTLAESNSMECFQLKLCSFSSLNTGTASFAGEPSMVILWLSSLSCNSLFEDVKDKFFSITTSNFFGETNGLFWDCFQTVFYVVFKIVLENYEQINSEIIIYSHS